jgi:hypothetical protein
VPIPAESIAEHIKAWKRVVGICIEESKNCSAKEKERWLEAKAGAEAIIAKLVEIPPMEKATTKLYRAAQKKLGFLKAVPD